jgi:hypothetical protein
MTSPLLPYVNACLLITSEGIPEIVDGRIISESGSTYLVQCYMKRQDSQGVTTGASYEKANTMPGASGNAYLYRGYALRYAETANVYDLDNANFNIAWTELKSTAKPSWLVDGLRCKHKQGLEQIKYCIIERCSGAYGGNKIDALIGEEIGGIPITVRSGDVLN